MKPLAGLSAPVILGVVCFGVFTTALDQTVVVTALPTMMPDLKIPTTAEGLDQASWIITAYLLAYTSAMPLIGRLADVYGYVRVYKASLIVFSVGTSLVAIASNLEWMVGARVVQAIGGGATVPISMAIACAVLPSHRRGLGIGLVVASAEAGSMLGPCLRRGHNRTAGLALGVLAQPAPKRSVVPRAEAAAKHAPDRRASGLPWRCAADSHPGPPISYPFAGRAVQPLFPGTSHHRVPTLGIAVSFILLERHTLQPLLAGFLFRSRAFLTANLTQLLEGVAFIIAIVTVPLMADTVMEKTR